MKRRTSTHLTVLLLALSGFAASASQPILDALVEKGLAQNPGLKAQRAKVEATRQLAPQMKALPDPTADIEFMNIAADGSSGSETFSRGVSLGVTQMLPFPGKRKLAEKVALGEVAVESARLAMMEQMVRAEVFAAAFRYKMACELLRLNTQTTDALHVTAESALARYASGMGSQSEVLVAQSEVTKTAIQRSELESQRAVALARLESLLAAPVDGVSLEQVELPPPSPLPPLAPLLDFAAERSLEVRMAQAMTAVAEANAEMARKESKPDFMVGGRYRFGEMSMDGGDYLTAMVGMTLPFFHFKDRYRPMLAEALSKKQQTQEEARQAISSARFKVAEAYQTGERNAAVFTLYDQGLLVQARQAYESSLSSYRTGRTEFGALLMSLTALFMYESDAVMARAEYHQSVAEMEAVLGTALPEAAASTEHPTKTGGSP